MTSPVTPFSLKDAPALIERLLPVQKLSAEVYKERVAGTAQALTALGNFWKGRKPLILNKACILGCLLPATGDNARDLEIFEKLMAMDAESFAARWKRPPKTGDILAQVAISRITDYFDVKPDGVLPVSAPVDLSRPEYKSVKVNWRSDISLLERRRLEVQLLPDEPYREWVIQSYRPEEMMDTVHEHIWDAVNVHLGTKAHSFPELVEQLGIMRFGHRPRVADTFCGSGQIPFEAARLGCDVYASDLNPVACMLTWGAINIVGAPKYRHENFMQQQLQLFEKVQSEIDKLGVETDGQGWRVKVFLYCMETRCPQTGWMVPLLPTRIVSNGYSVIAELVPDERHKRYDIVIRSNVPKEQLTSAAKGTVQSEGRGQDPYLVHMVNGVEYRTKISTLRGDYRLSDGKTGSGLRLWTKEDFQPRPNDIFQERLYCVQWMRPKKKGRGDEYEFRKVTPADLTREKIVEDYVATHLLDWQNIGLLPDMKIESGYNTDQPIRERGWTYWHHLFNPRQLLVAGLLNKYSDEVSKFSFARVLNYSSKLSIWDNSFSKGCGNTVQTFNNQALNNQWC